MKTSRLYMPLLTELGALEDGCATNMSRLTALSYFSVSFQKSRGVGFALRNLRGFHTGISRFRAGLAFSPGMTSNFGLCKVVLLLDI
jgi:hypothetical protein